MDAIDITGIVFLIIDYFILLPVLLYCLYLFHQTSKDTHTDHIHRSTTLVYIINIAIIFSVVIERPFLLCSKVWLIFDIPIWIIYMLSSLTWDCIMLLFIIKVYHLYYKQNYNSAIASMSWRKDINENDTDWYILQKQRFGSTIFCIKFATIPYVLSVLTQTFVPYSNLFSSASETVYFLLNTSITSVLIIMALIIYHKSKALVDIYGVRNELLYQCLGVAISLFLYVLVTVVFAALNSESLNRIEWLIYMPISYIVMISLGLVSTVYPIWFIKRQEMSNKLPLTNVLSTSHSTDDMINSEVMEAIRTSKAMEHIISDHQSFVIFMQYLITEFSTENLLFLVELVEIKYAFQMANDNVIRVPRKNLAQPQYYNVFDFVFKKEQTLAPETPPLPLPQLSDAKSSNKHDNSRYIVLDFNPTSMETQKENTLYSFLFQTDNIVHTKLSIPSELPKSAILVNHDNLLDQMKSLYFKYVRSGSLHEINLSYTVRNAVTKFFEHSTAQLNQIKIKSQHYKLFNVLDECGIEIILLMTQSFQRFLKSDKINKKLLQQLIHKGLIDGKINNNNHVVAFRNAESLTKIKNQRTYVD